MNAPLVHKGLTSLPTAYNKSCYDSYSPCDVPLLTFACNPEDAFPNMYFVPKWCPCQLIPGPQP